MSKANFEIAYDGDALRDHAMDVDQLAPALLAIGDLCREANRVLNGDRASVAVRVVADFDRKCFDIHFQLIQSVYGQLKDLVSDDHVATAKTMLEWLGLISSSTTLSLVGFKKWKKGAAIQSATKIITKDGVASYSITIVGNGNTITIPEPVYQLATDKKVAKAEKAVVRPLMSNGIDTFQIRTDGKVTESISKEEAAYFGDAESSGDDDEPSQVIQAILELRSPVFAQGEKWQFNFGDLKIPAEITDPQFLRRVFVNGDRFGVGDKLKVNLRVRQYQTKSGNIKNAYEIERVLDVWEAKEQRALPLEPGDFS